MKDKIDNIEVIYGDLTSMDLDIIVNAANHTLLGGAGIDGIIHYKDQNSDEKKYYYYDSDGNKHYADN